MRYVLILINLVYVVVQRMNIVADTASEITPFGTQG